MFQPPLLLSDAEIDDLCAPLKQSAAQVRFLRQWGLIVRVKPNGRAAVLRSHAEAVLSLKVGAEPVCAGVSTWATPHATPDQGVARLGGRHRSPGRVDWPRGLYEPRRGYFVWDSPITGKARAIGRVPLADAKLQAIEANLWAKQQEAAPRLVDKLKGSDGLTVAQWLDGWHEALGKAGELAPNTIKSYQSSINAVKATDLGGVLMAKAEVQHVADALEEIQEERGARTAQACRSVLKTAFTAAMAKGRMKTNPATLTAAVKVKVQRQRFTWETFSKVWAELQQPAWPVWLRNATALALVTGQRREDIAAARFADFTDDDWLLIQGKTGHRVAIPLDLRLDILGLSVRDVLQACWRTGVASKHLVHQVRPRGNSPVGSPMHENRITKRFTEAVVAALGEGENLPTFHELRSLCKRLLKQQHGVDTKALLGHTTERMEDMYADPRGAEFERVSVAPATTVRGLI